ncbi:MAG: hypothetical protein D3910_05940, partial [Candidatus Electrothrix sp. ATG2]|nr:hypothetical protein [Candidatus Electrothrix sp. ATG2]
YLSFDGVQGAIGMRAESTLEALPSSVQDALQNVFRELVEVDERGIVTRQRAPMKSVASTEEAKQLVGALIDARLLVSNTNSKGSPIVEVAHEALLRSWPRLASWIESCDEDLRQLRQVRIAVEEWVRHEKGEEFQWHEKRRYLQAGMLKNFRPMLSDDEWEFLGIELKELQELYQLIDHWVLTNYDQDELLPESKQRHFRKLVKQVSVKLTDTEKLFIYSDLRLLRDLHIQAVDWKNRGYPDSLLWSEDTQSHAREVAQSHDRKLNELEILFVDKNQRLLKKLFIDSENWVKQGQENDLLWSEDQQKLAKEAAQKYGHNLSENEQLFIISDLRLLRSLQIESTNWEEEGFKDDLLWPDHKQQLARGAAERYGHMLSDTEKLFIISELRLLRSLQIESTNWKEEGFKDDLLWPDHKQQLAREAVERYGHMLSDTEKRFLVSDYRQWFGKFFLTS